MSEGRYYKTLQTGRIGQFSHRKWPHLKQWTPTRSIEMCRSGWHVTDREHLIDWLSDEIYVAEIGGDWLFYGEKTVASRARLTHQLNWDKRIAHLFAADCAEDVLHIFETDHPHDTRPRETIETVRRFANSEASDIELAAARHAAQDAARRSTRDAAMVAALIAGMADATSYGIYATPRHAANVAQDAAVYAARNTTTKLRQHAGNVARAAARTAQTARLFHYLEDTP